MKKRLSLLLAVLVVMGLALVGCGGTATEPEQSAVPTPENPTIRLSTTTSVNDSGLLPYLQPTFEARPATSWRSPAMAPARPSSWARAATPTASWCTPSPLRKSLSTAVLA